MISAAEISCTYHTAVLYFMYQDACTRGDQKNTKSSVSGADNAKVHRPNHHPDTAGAPQNNGLKRAQTYKTRVHSLASDANLVR